MSTVSLNEQQRASWGLQDHFGSIFVINLEQAKDRRIQITKSLERIGVFKEMFEFFKATDGRKELDESVWKKMYMNWAKIDTSTPEGRVKLNSQFQGEAGCYMSHYRLLQHVSKAYDEAKVELRNAERAGDSVKIAEAEKAVKKYSSVLILEDDTGFGIVQKDGLSVTSEKCEEIFKAAMKELPPHWDMLYFNALVRDISIEQSEHLARLTGGDHTNAYAVHHRMYKILLKALQPIENPDVKEIDPVDTTIHHLHPRRYCFCVLPSIAFQEKGESSITSTQKKLTQKQADARGLVTLKVPEEQDDSDFRFHWMKTAMRTYWWLKAKCTTFFRGFQR
jgi:GR25 family glycosyltransferase involved in LPS biosynthesis